MKNRSKKIDDELEALARMRDEDIDTSDIPEVTDWSGALVGKFYRPVKESISLRLDADILAWLKGQGPGYQTRLNELLRNAMTSAHVRRRGDATPRRTHVVASESRCQFRFPALERHGELKRWNEIAGAISERHCLFAVAK